MKFHIETERLILRELRITDLEGMFGLDSDPEVYKYLGNKPEINNQASHNALWKIGLDYIEGFYFEEEQLNLRWYKIKMN